MRQPQAGRFPSARVETLSRGLVLHLAAWLAGGMLGRYGLVRSFPECFPQSFSPVRFFFMMAFMTFIMHLLLYSYIQISTSIQAGPFTSILCRQSYSSSYRA